MSQPQIEIGAVHPDELDAMIGLMSTAFAMPLAAARDVFYSDPYFDFDCKRVLRVDGRLTACLTVVESQCWIGQGIVSLAGIAGVVTQPEARRSGYAGLLLADTVRYLRRRGFALAGLVPLVSAYYRRFGWEQAAFAPRFLTAPAHLPPFPEHRHVRTAFLDDAPALKRLYDTFSHTRTLHCLRDEPRWHYILQTVRQRAVYAPEPGTIEGYLLFDYKPTGTTADAHLTLPLTLQILEFYAATPAARRGLTGYLARQQNIGCISYDAAPFALSASGLPDLIASGDAPMASVETVPMVMLRVVDFVRTIDALRANWQGFCGELGLILTDSLLESGGDAVVVNGTETGVTVRTVTRQEARQAAARLEGDVRAWAQVVAGHVSGGDACALNRLQAASPGGRESADARASADELFPNRAPFLPPPDHF